MNWQLLPDIELIQLNAGVALYDNFRNDTHFIPPPYHHLLLQLENTHRSEEFLLNYLRQCVHDYPSVTSGEAQNCLSEFLHEAERLNLITAKV